MARNRVRSLSRQINRRAVILSLITLLSLGSTLVESLRYQLSTVHNDLVRVNQNAAETFDLFILDLESSLLTTAATVSNSKEVSKNLRFFLSRYPSILEVSYLNSAGQITEQYRKFGRPARTQDNHNVLLKQPFPGDRARFSPLQYEGSRPFIDIAVSVPDDLGLPTGFLSVRLGLTELWDTTLDVEIGKTGYAYLATESGQLIAHRSLNTVQAEDSLDRLLDKTPQGISQANLPIYRGLEGQWVLASARPLRQVAWYAMVEKPLIEALSPLVLPVILLLILAVSILLILGNAISFTRRRLVIPLQKLGQAISATRQGQATFSLNFHYHDEFHEIANLLNEISQENFDLYNSLEDEVIQRTKDLKRSQEKFSKAFYSNPDPMGIIGFPDGALLELNAAMTQALQSHQEEIVGSSFLVFTHNESEENRDFIATLKSQSKVQDWEVRFPSTTQAHNIYLLSAELMELESRACCLVRLQNITSRYNAERDLAQAKETAELANRAKSDFLSSMSHELRTPLNAILGFSQIISRDSHLNQNHRENIEIINRSGEHLLTLINNILEMSKIEAGKITLNLVDCDLHELLRSLKEMLTAKANQKGILFSVYFSKDVPQYVRIDMVKLRQVLLNLLSNAIKFTGSGTVELEVAVGEETGQIRFKVRDTGLGVSIEELAQLFEPFTQAESGKQNIQGTGLGLAISHRFVSLMGGELSVVSELGRGSTFTFEIRVQEAADKLQTIGRKQRKVIGLVDGQKIPKLLVVDDHPDNRKLLVDLLSSIGLSVAAAGNGKEAIDECRRWNPDLVWMDVQMPVMGGLEATQQLKAKMSSPPIVIALTAHAFEEECTLALAAGCDDFIRKPFLESEIWERLSRFLNLSYTYENDPSLDTEATVEMQDVIAIRKCIQALPLKWRQQLKSASQRLNNRMIQELLAELSPEQEALKAEIELLTHQFRYDIILTMLESVES